MSPRRGSHTALRLCPASWQPLSHSALVAVTVSLETEVAFSLSLGLACCLASLVLRVLWFNSDFSLLSRGTALCFSVPGTGGQG